MLISSELEELMGLAHRVLVFRKGRVVAEFEEGQPTARPSLPPPLGPCLNGRACDRHPGRARGG